jgi:RNA polymerase sigma-70 factor, ECF subfamily
MEDEAEFRANYGVVSRVLQRLGVPPRDVDDVRQSVFLIAFEARDRFEGRSSFKTWVVGIAVRLAANYRRAAPTRREVLGGVDPCGAVAEDLQQLLEKREDLRALETILARMPEAERIVFQLVVLEELTAEEVSAILAVRVGTVKSRLRRARAKFRVELVSARTAPSLPNIVAELTAPFAQFLVPRGKGVPS